MARLSIPAGGLEIKDLDLHFGTNTFGRNPGNHWQISHPTISGKHCEIMVELDGVRVKDCGSTNGTFLDGRRIDQAVLGVNQVLRMGDVDFLVMDVGVNVAIPKFDVAIPAPPIVLETGAILCPKHPEKTATHQCSHCRTVMCSGCVHYLRRKGGLTLMLCPLCSHPVQYLGPEEKKKRSLADILFMTVKIPFKSGRRASRRRR